MFFAVLMMFVLGCSSTPKRIYSPISNSKNVRVEFKPKTAKMDEEFKKLMLNLLNKEGYKEELDKLMLNKVDNGDRYFVANASIVKLLNDISGMDIRIKERKNVVEYYIPEAVVNGKYYQLPNTVLVEDSGNISIYTYDLSDKKYKMLFNQKNYSLKDFNFYIKVFKKRVGYLLFLLAEDKREVDMTPFIASFQEYKPKLFFKKTDMYIVTEESFFSYANRDVSGIYTAIGVDTLSSKYELSFSRYIIKRIENRIDSYLKRDRDITSLFLDEYEETPFMLSIKEGMFKTCIAGIELLEGFASHYFAEIKEAKNTGKTYKVEKLDLAKKKFNITMQKTFKYLNLGLDSLLDDYLIEAALSRIEKLAKKDSQIEYARRRRNAIKKYLSYAYRKLGL